MKPKLSVLVPSHGRGPRIINNVVSTSLFAGKSVEVIIRDNSGDPDKRRQLASCCSEQATLLTVDECSAEENVMSLLREAQGDFILFCCDDDLFNPHSLPCILTELDRIGSTADVIGTTGNFIKEEVDRSIHIRFDTLDRPDVVDRFRGYFPENNHAIFQYSPIRREVVEAVWDVLPTLPIRLSYHDILMNCLFLMHGRFTHIDRFFYQYSNLNWTNEDASTASDARYYRASGLDTSAVALTWLIAISEGARLFTMKTPGIPVPSDQRLLLAQHWIRHWWPFFLLTSSRRAPDARFTAEAVALTDRWKARQNLDLDDLLHDIAGFFSLSAPDFASRYHAFWRQ